MSTLQEYIQYNAHSVRWCCAVSVSVLIVTVRYTNKSISQYHRTGCYDFYKNDFDNNSSEVLGNKFKFFIILKFLTLFGLLNLHRLK